LNDDLSQTGKAEADFIKKHKKKFTVFKNQCRKTVLVEKEIEKKKSN